MSNLKQLGLGVIQYTQDYDEKLPAAYDGNNPYTIDNMWMGKLDPYVKSPEIYFCPSDTQVGSSSPANGATFASKNVFWWVNEVSYGWNFIGLTYAACTPAGNGCGGVSLASLDNVSEIVMMADNGGKTNSALTQYVAQCQVDTPTGLTAQAPTAMHFDGGNFAFADGHVKWSKIPNSFLNTPLCGPNWWTATPARKVYWNY